MPHSADSSRMTCQNCGASVRLDRDQGLMICDYCGSQSTPPADEDGVQVLDPSQHDCPACKTALFNGRLERQDMLYCTTCHGMLIAMDDIVPLLEELRDHRERPAAYLAPRESQAVPTLDCPLCSHAMDHHAYGGGGNVMIDSCEDCSQLWLGRGALRKIAAAPDPEPVYSNYGGLGQSGLDGER
ncbi:MAG TPA: zf-TFIIB domain-containing protein [Bryobacteraceae bacterium]|nr:zf-TFIIB domain-containing protein [Bryobacteraceae bacterium]